MGETAGYEAEHREILLDLDAVALARMAIFAIEMRRLPADMFFRDGAHLRSVLEEDDISLAEVGPDMTHNVISTALQSASHEMAAKVAADPFRTSIQVNEWSGGSAGAFGGHIVILEKAGSSYLRFTQYNSGQWVLLNLHDGNQADIHEGLLGTIGRYGFYGAHEDRAHPADIARVLELVESQVAQDDPVRAALSSRDEFTDTPVILRNVDQVRRYTNVTAAYSILRDRPIRIQPLTIHEAIALQTEYGGKQDFFGDVYYVDMSMVEQT